MTREEAINVIKEHIDTYVTCHGEEDTVAVSLDNVDIEAFDMAVKALEQQPKTDVLDKIRAEMQFYSNSFVLAGRNDLASAVSYCIEIIDKYKAESEDKK